MSAARPRGVLVIGDVMTDVIVRPEGPLLRGSDRRATIRSRPGGSGANQAVWLGAMGADVRFVARVGVADKPGLEAYFRSLGLQPLLSGDTALPSGVLVSIVDPDGERSFLTDRGANLALSPADLPESLLDGTAMLVVSGYSFFAEDPRAAVRGLCAQAQQRGIAIAIDPASVGFLLEVGTDNFLTWTSGASLLFANHDEASALAGSEDLEAQMRTLGDHYARVIIKRGPLGAALGDRSGVQLALPAQAVQAIDTTGAGDAFAAAFIAAEVLGFAAEECLARAIAAGSEAVQHLGGQPQR
jgi:sugar/nucleoside kinase (ribokinase family)